MKKVFNLGTAKSPPGDAAKSTDTQQTRKDDTDLQSPVYRAAVDLFNRLKDQEETLSILAFNKFLRQQHPSGHEYDEVFSIKETYGFSAFYKAWVDLGTSARGPLPPKDLSRPLTNYFISSSYNPDLAEISYSRTSAEIYRDVKLSEPIVTHDSTSTVSYAFREVCAEIRASAFVNNDLPVIVSLEVKADAEQQEVMVRIMKEEWGELLLDKSLEGYDPRFRLPNLGDLRRKILVKVKRSPARIIRPDHSSDSENSIWGSNPLSDATPEAKTSKVAICKALGDLGIYTQSHKFFRLDAYEAKRPPHIFSLSENKLLELNAKDETGVFCHNKSFFMRCLPSEHRRASSNLNPALFWSLGVQMVSMNWPEVDEGMMLHRGMFADEDGWVLKPAGYRSADKTTETRRGAVSAGFRKISVTIFSGFDIPDDINEPDNNKRIKRVLRPKVRVEFHCAEGGDDEDDRGWYKFNTPSSKTKDPWFGATGSIGSFKIKRTPPELTFVR
ncbi:hypothetical protein N0V84_004690 [Fusarium piperis]|uniref:Phosphoinositide phospholipase C n=1 Tax=Fusarium piperis TaxID=1435070 RepID=A0A9W8WF33_9HYPO|nr:hypothetical protein N0V84_004690 [Fusarium piperis]